VPVDPIPIRALVVDYGEVLCHPADPTGLTEMATYAGMAPEPFLHAYWELREPYDRGVVPAAEYWGGVVDTAGIGLSEDQVRGLVQRDIALWTRLDAEMISWVEALAARGVRVGLLSNIVREIGTYMREEMTFLRPFTDITLSFEVGSVKPEPEIYRRALAGVGTAPHETLFVDDRLVNVEAARRAGMHAHHFRGRDPLLVEIDARYAFAA
jgi:putative hydrolase of the HAD superfamily